MSDYESIASAASLMDGSIDHVWLRRLQGALDETECPASLEDALRPLMELFSDEIDAGDLQAAVEGQRELWRDLLYSAEGGFDLPRSYLLDWAVAIYVYTLSDPKVFKVVNGEMFNHNRRKPGMSVGVSDGLRACLPYIRFLIHALKALPASYVFRGEVRRGVKHAYPSPEDHDPVGHFRVGKRLAWYEFKSTSKKAEVMMRDHFCGPEAGPRTTFIVDVICGYDISRFSYFQGAESEYEVLLLPMSQFEVVHAAKNIIDPKETVCIRRSGFPDTVHLRQVETAHAPAAAGGQAAQEQADAALARALQELEHQDMLKQHQMRQENAQVELHSLLAAENNGKRGRLVSFDTEAGRWKVEMKNGDVLKLKPANLRVVSVQATGPYCGKQVKIHGLQAKPELNGRVGLAASYNDAAGSYNVKLPDGSAIALQPKNLEPVAGEGQQGHHSTDYGYATAQLPNAPPMSGQQIPDTGREGVQGLWFFECVHPTPAPAPRRRRVAPWLRACVLRAFA